jgi:hypothetical protein
LRTRKCGDAEAPSLCEDLFLDHKGRAEVDGQSQRQAAPSSWSISSTMVTAAMFATVLPAKARDRQTPKATPGCC